MGVAHFTFIRRRAACVECGRWAAGSRSSRSDAEAASDGGRQRQERFRRVLVRVARLSTDDSARQPGPVLPADQSVPFRSSYYSAPDREAE